MLKVESKKLKAGYTMIETMIAASIFITVMASGMGAVLNATLLHDKSQDIRSIMDNLNFVMEDMSRNLRTGEDYRCVSDNDYVTTTPLSCDSATGISFSPIPTEHWGYKIESNKIWKSVDSGTRWVSLTTNDIAIDSASGFSILGAEPPPGDLQQPLINIRLVGTITLKGSVTPFSLQTSVSRRLIDV